MLSHLYPMLSWLWYWLLIWMVADRRTGLAAVSMRRAGFKIYVGEMGLAGPGLIINRYNLGLCTALVAWFNYYQIPYQHYFLTSLFVIPHCLLFLFRPTSTCIPYPSSSPSLPNLHAFCVHLSILLNLHYSLDYI